MDWKTFIAQIVSALAWPLAIVAIFTLFRGKIGRFIDRINRLKYGETELEFAQSVSEISSEKIHLARGHYKSAELNEKSIELSKVADIDPRAAILTAYAYLEGTVKSAVTDPDLKDKSISAIINSLVGKPLMGSHLNQFIELRRLRNKVAHADQFEMTGMLVQEYIDICLSLADVLKQHIAERKALEPSK